MMNIDVKDLYEFIITECRYGYTRNNHLMPYCAYLHVWKYLPKMLEENKEIAIHTAQQLCEECINSQMFANFYDRNDDEFGNKKAAVEFIEKLLNFIQTNIESDDEWLPYNYDLYYFKDFRTA